MDTQEKTRTKGSPKTFIANLFGGKLKSVVTCLECGSVSSLEEPFLDLSLPIPDNSKPATQVTYLTLSSD